jgi:hypothetical protein
MGIWRWIKSILFRPKLRWNGEEWVPDAWYTCLHPRGDERTWVEPDGTKMMSFRCPDCGYRDRGHYH